MLASNVVCLYEGNGRYTFDNLATRKTVGFMNKQINELKINHNFMFMLNIFNLNVNWLTPLYHHCMKSNLIMLLDVKRQCL